MSKLKRKDLKVGKKVRLAKNPAISDYDTCAMGWSSSMEKHLGTVVTIDEIKHDACRNLDYVRVEENMWSWDIRLLEPVKEKPVSKVHDVEKFADVDCDILPFRYALDKVVENGEAVICWVLDMETGKVIKSVAVCQDEDTFNLNKGVEICLYKTLRKIAENNLKKF